MKDSRAAVVDVYLEDSAVTTAGVFIAPGSRCTHLQKGSGREMCHHLHLALPHQLPQLKQPHTTSRKSPVVEATICHVMARGNRLGEIVRSDPG